VLESSANITQIPTEIVVEQANITNSSQIEEEKVEEPKEEEKKVEANVVDPDKDYDYYEEEKTRESEAQLEENKLTEAVADAGPPPEPSVKDRIEDMKKKAKNAAVKKM
jgi:hypothetical protein